VIASIFSLSAYFSAGLNPILGLFAALILSTPFLWAMTVGRLTGPSVTRLWRESQHRTSLIALEAARVAVAIALIGTLASQFVTWESAFALTTALIFAFVLLFSRYLKLIYLWFEKRFIENLTDKASVLAPWDAHIVRMEVPADSEFVGHTLEELKIRERFGVTVAMIQRGNRQITAPVRGERLYPFDRISVIGVDDQISGFRASLAPMRSGKAESAETVDYGLHPVKVNERSTLCHKTIRDSGVRERLHGLVVGLERREERILNPDSTMVIEPGDTLWIVGDSRRVKDLDLEPLT
jgi:CPA2 family monovalent cation:H+ antiporter-2